MKKIIFSLMLFIAIPCSIFAEQTFTVFGPEKITRETGSPQNFVKEFTVQDVNREYRLEVQNGEGKRGKASSAVIKLNGSQIFGPNAFNQQVENISANVKLLTSNKIVVEMRSQPGSSIIVRIVGTGDNPNPPVYPISDVTVKPGGFPINTPTDVVFNVEIPYDYDKPWPVVELIRVDESGTFISTEGVMLDNGKLANGDEIEADGVFSFRKTYNVRERSYIYLRVKTTIGGKTSYSETFNLNVYKPLTEIETETMLSVNRAGSQLYRRLLASEGEERAIAEAVNYYKSQSIVKEVGVSDGGVWVKYTNGIEGGFLFSRPGAKGGGTLFPENSNNSNSTPLIPSQMTNGSNNIGSKKVLLLAPFLDDFGEADDPPRLRTFFENYNNSGNCTRYDVTYLQNGQVGVGSFKALGSYGIVHVSSHGGHINNRTILLTRTPATTANIATYHDDLNSNPIRLVTIDDEYGRTWLATTPEFFRYYITSFPNTLLFFSSCQSTRDNSMWNALRHRGAGALLGFSHNVGVGFAVSRSEYFYNRWIRDQVTVSEAFNGGCDNAFGGCWNLLGSTNLGVPSGNELQDGSFESGSLTTWNPQGDGRIVTRLGSFVPTNGSRMGLISTGLGFTVNSGSLSQTFCIPGNATTLSLDWNFISEEFREYCGSPFQDFFRISLITENGTVHTLFYRNVDNVCNSTFQVPFSFDQGDVWATGWNSLTLNISAIATENAGRNVTLRFEVGDVGDSIYDTAVLIDNIRIATQ